MAYQFDRRHPDNAENPWKTLSIQEVYQNPWISLTHRTVINPSGGDGIYGVVHFKNTAVGVVPLDEHGNTWLIGQYRYTLSQYSWEIPEGGGNINEDPLVAAKRELWEETGITADTWIPLLETHLSNSVTDEYGVAYVAQNLQFGNANPEETELLSIKKLPFAEAFEMVISGKITDTLSMISIMKTQFWLEKGILKF